MIRAFRLECLVLAAILCVVAAVMSASIATAADVFVRPGESIQKAVDLSLPGDTVIIEDGAYKENIRIGKQLQLISRGGRDKCVIAPLDPKLPVIFVENASGVIIKGITVTGAGASAGFSFLNSNGGAVSLSASVSNYTGIFVKQSSDIFLSENDIKDNLDGITLLKANRNRLISNKVDNNNEKGILLVYSDSNMILSNSASMNYWNGLTLWDSSNNTVTDNVFVKNTYAIVESNSTGNEFSGNSTMRRLYMLLPVALIYLGIIAYLIEKKAFILYDRYFGNK